jgi:DNA helicase INO80
LLSAQHQLSAPSIASSTVLKHLVFASVTSYGGNTTYTHTRHIYHSMPETVEHRILRSRKAASVRKGVSEPEAGTEMEDQRSAGKSITVSPLHRTANKPSPTSSKVQLVVSSSDYVALNEG